MYISIWMNRGVALEGRGLHVFKSQAFWHFTAIARTLSMFLSFSIWRKEDFSNPSAPQVHLPTHIVCIFLGCLFLFCIPCLLSVTFMFHLPPRSAQSDGDIKHLLPYWLRKLLFISPENSHFIAAPSTHTHTKLLDDECESGTASVNDNKSGVLWGFMQQDVVRLADKDSSFCGGRKE